LKIIILLLLSNSFINVLAQKPMQFLKTKAAVSGIATETNDNEPNNEATLMANASFKVVEGKLYKGQLPVISFITDDKGNFYLELPVGVYCIVEEERPEIFTLKESTTKEKWDNDCRKKQWQTPLFVLSLKTTDHCNIKINKHVSSHNPCLKN
jgi:Prealbumin-like fold domain